MERHRIKAHSAVPSFSCSSFGDLHSTPLAKWCSRSLYLRENTSSAGAPCAAFRCVEKGRSRLTRNVQRSIAWPGAWSEWPNPINLSLDSLHTAGQWPHTYMHVWDTISNAKVYKQANMASYLWAVPCSVASFATPILEIAGRFGFRIKNFLHPRILTTHTDDRKNCIIFENW